MEAQRAEDALVSRAQGGDAEALHELVVWILPSVRNLVRYLVRGDPDVDDLAQEGMVTVLRGLASYQGTGTFKAWANRVVARSVFAARRKRAQLREVPEVDVAPEIAPDDLAEQYQRRRQVVGLLDQLPSEQRDALVLHYAVGLSVAEVAFMLDASAETVRSRLRLAKRKLRQNSGAGRDA